MANVVGRIIDKITRKSVEFKYFSGLGNSLSANYEEEDGIIGRSEPHTYYRSTGADTFNLTIQLSVGAEQKDNRTTKDVYDDYLFLKSFQFPDYGNNKAGPLKPPHEVILIIGNFLRKTGIIFSPTFKLDSVADENGYPHVIEVAFTFKVINKTPLDCNDIIIGTKYVS